MSRLTDELEQKRLQREADMREAQTGEAQPPTAWGLYTYQTLPAAAGSEPHIVCHIYAPGSQEQCQEAGRVLQEAAAAANEPPLLYMVLPVEPLPA